MFSLTYNNSEYIIKINEKLQSKVNFLDMLPILVIKISDFWVSLKKKEKQLKVTKRNKTNRTNGVISVELCIHVFYMVFLLDSSK